MDDDALLAGVMRRIVSGMNHYWQFNEEGELLNEQGSLTVDGNITISAEEWAALMRATGGRTVCWETSGE